MNYNQPQQPQSKNYLAYDISGSAYDKYEGYVVTNFEQSSKNLNQPSNILQLEENSFPSNQNNTRQAPGGMNNFNQASGGFNNSHQASGGINNMGSVSGGINNVRQYHSVNQPQNSYAMSNNQQYLDVQPGNMGYGSGSQEPRGFQVLNTPTETQKQKIPQPSQNYYHCPVCMELAVSSCDCEYRDCYCANGHKWYRVSGVKTMGISPNHKGNR